MSAALNYVCGKCLARLEHNKPDGAWRHAGRPNCGKEPVPMFLPLHRERLRRDTANRIVPDNGHHDGPRKRAV
jgi:hypothetical protein